MSSHDMNEVLLSPEDVVMLQEVALEGEGPEDTLSRVLSECRREWMKKGAVAAVSPFHEKKEYSQDAAMVIELLIERLVHVTRKYRELAEDDYEWGMSEEMLAANMAICTAVTGREVGI